MTMTVDLLDKLREAMAEIRRLRTVCVAQASEIERLRTLERAMAALAAMADEVETP
jgi:hypothetical protein